MYEVIYKINATGVVVIKKFDYEPAAYRLKNKLEHSKKCTLISYMKYPF